MRGALTLDMNFPTGSCSVEDVRGDEALCCAAGIKMFDVGFGPCRMEGVMAGGGDPGKGGGGEGGKKGAHTPLGSSLELEVGAGLCGGGAAPDRGGAGGLISSDDTACSMRLAVAIGGG